MNSVEKIKSEIRVLEKQLATIQKECNHPPSTLTKKAKSNTGNWCKADDTYWYECRCGLCGKFWTEPQ